MHPRQKVVAKIKLYFFICIFLLRNEGQNFVLKWFTSPGQNNVMHKKNSQLSDLFQSEIRFFWVKRLESNAPGFPARRHSWSEEIFAKNFIPLLALIATPFKAELPHHIFDTRTYIQIRILLSKMFLVHVFLGLKNLNWPLLEYL
jgi:hypothetical protein